MKPITKSVTQTQLVVIILISLIIICSLLILIRNIFSQPPVSYIAANVSKRDIEEKVLASGTLYAFKTVDVGAQVSGQLKKLHVGFGDYVKKGQLLAEIDPVLQQNALKSAASQVASSQAQQVSKQILLKQYELAYDRQLKMVGKGATSQADLENARAKVDTTRADIISLRAQIEQAKIAIDTAVANLGYTKIVAPMNGVVVSIVTEEGQTVVSTQSATTILKLADLDTITVKAQISEADVMRVYPGQKVYFTTIGDSETRYYGKLRAIEPGPVGSTGQSPSGSGSSSSGSGAAIYYNALFEVPNPGHKLRMSMTVQVSVILQEVKQALCVPISALGSKGEDGYYTIRVLLRNDLPEIRKVKIGITDNIFTQVLTGLQENDKVILGDDSVSPDTATEGNATRTPSLKIRKR